MKIKEISKLRRFLNLFSTKLMTWQSKENIEQLYIWALVYLDVAMFRLFNKKSTRFYQYQYNAENPIRSSKHSWGVEAELVHWWDKRREVTSRDSIWLDPSEMIKTPKSLVERILKIDVNPAEPKTTLPFKVVTNGLTRVKTRAYGQVDKQPNFSREAAIAKLLNNNLKQGSN
jgi:hypothetical protein